MFDKLFSSFWQAPVKNHSLFTIFCKHANGPLFEGAAARVVESNVAFLIEYLQILLEKQVNYKSTKKVTQTYVCAFEASMKIVFALG